MRLLRFRFRTLSTIFAVVAALAVLSPLSAQVSATLGDDIVTVVAVPMVAPAVVPEAGIPPAAMTNVSVGAQINNYPCFNCPGAGTIAIPIPMAFITHGANVGYTLIFQDVNYAGACSVIYAIKQGSGFIAGKSYDMPSPGCQKNYLYYVNFKTTAPNKTGAATLMGILQAGSATSAATLPIYLQ